jgi:ankyrin repeat protein
MKFSRVKSFFNKFNCCSSKSVIDQVIDSKFDKSSFDKSVAYISNNRFNNLISACKDNNAIIVETILNQEPEIVNNRDSSGCTPLHYACAEGHLRIVRLLIERSIVDLNALDNNGFSPFYYAVMKGHIDVYKYLLDGPNTTLKKTYHNIRKKSFNDTEIYELPREMKWSSLEDKFNRNRFDDNNSSSGGISMYNIGHGMY